jgi:hypothetical protein
VPCRPAVEDDEILGPDQSVCKEEEDGEDDMAGEETDLHETKPW